MFQTVSLSIIRSLVLYTQQHIRRYADCLLAGSGLNILILLASSQQNLYVLMCVQY